MGERPCDDEKTKFDVVHQQQKAENNSMFLLNLKRGSPGIFYRWCTYLALMLQRNFLATTE
uniref:Uncharacterized protein n=1 Tax=Arundo donax TaxID=35708 RepID=A0A0A8ZZE2_ARUDO